MKAARVILTVLAGIGSLVCLGLTLYCMYRYNSLPAAKQHPSPWDDLGWGSAIAAVLLGAVAIGGAEDWFDD